MTDLCLICGRREPTYAQVCDPDREGLTNRLIELSDLHSILMAGTVAEIGVRRVSEHTKPAPAQPKRNILERKDRFGWWRDAFAAVAPVGPIRAPSNAPRVTGSRERPLGVAVSPLDLILPFGPWAAIHDPKQDQTGHLPTVQVLDAWAREWVELREETLPPPTVHQLIAWLIGTSGVRIEWACDEFPAIDSFAAEIRAQLNATRAALGLIEPHPARKDSVCAKCGTQGLFQANGSTYIECAMCPAIMTETEYRDWLRLQIKSGKRPVEMSEVEDACA